VVAFDDVSAAYRLKRDARARKKNGDKGKVGQGNAPEGKHGKKKALRALRE
jgi:hypothetical protein